MSKSKKIAVEKSVQKEVLIKRLLFQLAFDQLQIADKKTEHEVQLDIAPATLNRLKWEHVIVHAEQLNEEWDHIIAAFDDPGFDWENATPPKMSEPSDKRKKWRPRLSPTKFQAK